MVITFQCFLLDLSVSVIRSDTLFGARIPHLDGLTRVPQETTAERRKIARGRGSARATRCQDEAECGWEAGGPRGTVPLTASPDSPAGAASPSQI